MPTGPKIALVAAGVVTAVVLFVVLRPEGDAAAEVAPAAQATQPTTGEAAGDGTDTQTGTETETEAGAQGETETGRATASPGVVRARIAIGRDGPTRVERIEAKRGQRAVLTIQSRVRDHVHVHGYDLLADVAPGRLTRITFTANVPGRFEIELEDRHELVAELRVTP